MQKPSWIPKNVADVLLAVALGLLPVLLLTLLVVSIAQRSYAEPLFIHTTYYFLLVLVVCWA